MADVSAFLTRFETQGWQADPYAELFDILDTRRAELPDLARGLIERFPDAGAFFDDIISHLTRDELQSFVRYVFDPSKSLVDNAAATELIAQVAEQFPELLITLLPIIFETPELCTDRARKAWFGAGEGEIERLFSLVRTADTDPAQRQRAFQCLFETRDIGVMRELYVLLQDILDNDQLQEIYRSFDQDVAEGVIRPLCSGESHHIIFPKDYPDFFDGETGEIRRRHPSWTATEADRQETAIFGGNSVNTCSLCDGTLHNLIRVPGTVGKEILSGREVAFATCMTCLGWHEMPLFYKHNADGVPHCMNGDAGSATPEYTEGPLKQVSVTLAPTPVRWRRQDWAASNARQNLNKIGGFPSWIQGAQYPECPECSRTMRFALQLDSELAMEDGTSWLWGSGGMCYAFWCSDCSISATLWQST
jgi:hypothetical protein